jgi:predicted N-acetyltransferase YhbS
VAFLKGQGYPRAIPPEDRVFAAFRGGDVVAVVRLAPEEGVVVLRGMRVRPDVQRRGVGRELLRVAASALGHAECYCIAYRWLTSFYGEAGFAEMAPEAAPPFLATRFAGYVADGSSVVLMRRPGG